MTFSKACLFGFLIFLAACVDSSTRSKISVNYLDVDVDVDTQCNSAQLRRNAGDFVRVPFLPGYLSGVAVSNFELLSDFEGGNLAILQSDCVALVNFFDEIAEIAPPRQRHPGFVKEPFGGRITETVEQAVGRCADKGLHNQDAISSDIISYSAAEPCHFIVDTEVLELVVTTKSSEINLFLAFGTMFIWGEDSG
ncbi:MAG: hypothetical protein ABJN14_17055 [Paracoccaceae bacterium]